MAADSPATKSYTGLFWLLWAPLGICLARPDVHVRLLLCPSRLVGISLLARFHAVRLRISLCSRTQRSSTCEKSLSDLLEAIDGEPGVANEPLESAVEATEHSVFAMVEAAEPVVDDIRVPPRRDLLLETWSELAPMARDLLEGGQASATPPLVKDINSSDSASLPYSASDRSIVSTPATRSRTTSASRLPRSVSKPRLSALSTASDDVRTISRSTSRISLRSDAGSTLSKSQSMEMPQSSARKPRTSGVPVSSRRSSLDHKRQPSYQPDPKRQVDVEVARVVNALPGRPAEVYEI